MNTIPQAVCYVIPPRMPARVAARTSRAEAGLGDPAPFRPESHDRGGKRRQCRAADAATRERALSRRQLGC